MTGLEYIVHEALEPHLYVIRKQRRDGPDKVSPQGTFYVLDGAIYQAPNLEAVVGSRLGRCLYHIREAFSQVSAKTVGNEDGDLQGQSEGNGVGSKTKTGGDSSKDGRLDKPIDIEEATMVDQILGRVLVRNEARGALPPPPPDQNQGR